MLASLLQLENIKYKIVKKVKQDALIEVQKSKCWVSLMKYLMFISERRILHIRLIMLKTDMPP